MAEIEALKKITKHPPRKTVAKYDPHNLPKIIGIEEHAVETGDGKVEREWLDAPCDMCGHNLKKGLRTENHGVIGYDCYLNLRGVSRPSGSISFKHLPPDVFEGAAKGVIRQIEDLSSDDLIKAATQGFYYGEGHKPTWKKYELVGAPVVSSPITVEYVAGEGFQKGKPRTWNAILDGGSTFSSQILGLDPKLWDKIRRTDTMSKYFLDARKRPKINAQITGETNMAKKSEITSMRKTSPIEFSDDPEYAWEKKNEPETQKKSTRPAPPTTIAKLESRLKDIENEERYRDEFLSNVESSGIKKGSKLRAAFETKAEPVIKKGVADNQLAHLIELEKTANEKRVPANHPLMAHIKSSIDKITPIAKTPLSKATMSSFDDLLKTVSKESGYGGRVFDKKELHKAIIGKEKFDEYNTRTQKALEKVDAALRSDGRELKNWYVSDWSNDWSAESGVKYDDIYEKIDPIVRDADSARREIIEGLQDGEDISRIEMLADRAVNRIADGATYKRAVMEKVKKGHVIEAEKKAAEARNLMAERQKRAEDDVKERLGRDESQKKKLGFITQYRKEKIAKMRKDVERIDGQEDTENRRNLLGKIREMERDLDFIVPEGTPSVDIALMHANESEYKQYLEDLDHLGKDIAQRAKMHEEFKKKGDNKITVGKTSKKQVHELRAAEASEARALEQKIQAAVKPKQSEDLEAKKQQRQAKRDLEWGKARLNEATIAIERRRSSEDPNYRDLGISQYARMDAERDALDSYVKALETGIKPPRPDLKIVGDAAANAASERMGEMMTASKDVQGRIQARSSGKQAAKNARAKATQANSTVAVAKEKQMQDEKPSKLLHRVYDTVNGDIRDPKLKLLNQKLLDTMGKRMDLKEGTKAWSQKIKQEAKAAGDIKRYEQKVASEKHEVLHKLDKEKAAVIKAREGSRKGSENYNVSVSAELDLDKRMKEIDAGGATELAEFNMKHESAIKRLVIPKVQALKDAIQSHKKAETEIQSLRKRQAELGKRQAKLENESERIENKVQKADNVETKRWNVVRKIQDKYNGYKAIKLEHRASRLEKAAKTEAQKTKATAIKATVQELQGRLRQPYPVLKTVAIEDEMRDAEIRKMTRQANRSKNPPRARTLADRMAAAPASSQTTSVKPRNEPTLASRMASTSSTRESKPITARTAGPKKEKQSEWFEAMRDFKKKGMSQKAATEAANAKLAKHSGQKAVKQQALKGGVNKLPRQGSRPQKGKEAKAKANKAAQAVQKHKTTVRPNKLEPARPVR
jgi:hypothetical protein